MGAALQLTCAGPARKSRQTNGGPRHTHTRLGRRNEGRPLSQSSPPVSGMIGSLCVGEGDETSPQSISRDTDARPVAASAAMAASRSPGRRLGSSSGRTTHVPGAERERGGRKHEKEARNALHVVWRGLKRPRSKWWSVQQTTSCRCPGGLGPRRQGAGGRRHAAAGQPRP